MVDQQAVNSIRFLVANSVPGLQHNHVSVVDILATRFPPTRKVVRPPQANNRLTARRNLELYLASKVESMLAGVLGPNQVHVP